MKFLLICLFFMNSVLNASIPFSLIEVAQNYAPLDKAQPFNGQEITVRGFLYRTQGGQWILSAEPNLKTCCAGSKEKALQQIFLPANFQGPNTDQVVTMTGRFEIIEGEHTFFLSDAVLVEEQKSGSIWLWVVGVTFGSIVFFRARARARARARSPFMPVNKNTPTPN